MTETPPSVPGDDKDWTWVLAERCPECGFEADTFDREAVASMLRSNSKAWVAVLEGDETVVRSRPDPRTWSVLEYGCHVRDVNHLYLERLDLMLTQDGPHYANWDQDVTAVESRYDLSSPDVVAAELVDAGEQLASRFDSVSGDQWNRSGYRSDGAAFTVESFARYLIHDPIHHLWDVSGPH